MKKAGQYLAICVLFLNTSSIWAQDNTAMLQSTRDRFQSNGTMNPGAGYIIYGMDGRKGELLGDNYLDPNWHEGEVQFYPHTVTYQGNKVTLDTIKGIPIRLDLLNNEVEFQTKYGNKAVLGETVQSFSFARIPGLSPTTFVNVKEFKGKAEEMRGFFELLADGNLKLLQYTKLWIKKPTYVPALDTGTKDTQILKDSHYYFAKGMEVDKFSGGKSALLKLMEDKKQVIEAYLRLHKSDLKNLSDLQAVFDYYNSLPKSY